MTEDGGVIGPTAGEVCCHITGATQINSTISHHLNELETAEIIRRDRKGKTIGCTLRTETLVALSHELLALANPQSSVECADMSSATAQRCC